MRANTGRNGVSAPLGRMWRRVWRSPLPTLGCEISSAGISLARWSAGSSRLDLVCWQSLSGGAVEASPLRENLLRPEELQEAFGACLGRFGFPSGKDSSRRPFDAALILPDQAARLFVLQFEALPERPADALSLLKWKLKKSVPFDIESATISYFAQRVEKQWEVVAVASPQIILRQYEAVLESFGLRPRWVTLSTVAALGLVRGEGLRAETGPNAASPAPEGRALFAGKPGILLLKCSPPWLTLAILQGGQLRLFRTVGLPAGTSREPSPGQVLEVLYPSIAYFQDHFQGVLGGAYLCGLGQSGEQIGELLQSAWNVRPAPLVEDSASIPEGWERVQAEWHLAGLLGLVREQRHG